MSKTQRKSWYHEPDISAGPTSSVLQKFLPCQQKTLLRELSGGFQSQIQKAKWLEGEDGKCPYCEELDTRTHRLLSCPIGTEVRGNYENLLEWISESGSGFPEFPFITVHPSHEALTCALFALEVPVMDFAIHDFVSQRLALGHDLHWFTDGSCYQSDSPESRYASFAIAVDLCENDADRILHACASNVSKVMPPMFQKVLAARTPGEQDILRSEMMAAARVMIDIGVGVIHVDSQVALNLLTLALTCHDPAVLYKKDHYDILLQVWTKRAAIQCQLVKVKAHETIADVELPLEQYWCWGNCCVDELAVYTRDHLLPGLVKELAAFNTDLQEQKLRLFQTYILMLELHNVRARAHVNLKDDQAATQHSADAIVQAYQQWRRLRPSRLDLQVDPEFWCRSMFGETLLRKTFHWLLQITWPTQLSTDGPLGFKTGVTWIELAVSWMLEHRCFAGVEGRFKSGEASCSTCKF